MVASRIPRVKFHPAYLRVERWNRSRHTGQNAESGNHGTVKLLRIYSEGEYSDIDCRSLKISLHNQDKFVKEGERSFCKNDKGEWDFDEWVVLSQRGQSEKQRSKACSPQRHREHREKHILVKRVCGAFNNKTSASSVSLWWIAF